LKYTHKDITDAWKMYITRITYMIKHLVVDSPANSSALVHLNLRSGKLQVAVDSAAKTPCENIWKSQIHEVMCSIYKSKLEFCLRRCKVHLHKRICLTALSLVLICSTAWFALTRSIIKIFFKSMCSKTWTQCYVWPRFSSENASCSTGLEFFKNDNAGKFTKCVKRGWNRFARDAYFTFLYDPTDQTPTPICTQDGANKAV
jgi:hypothetical protein